MLNYAQAILLGLVQGASELFPVSSLGHSVILPRLLDWQIDQSTNFFLVFLVATHLATSLVLLCFFRKDWILIVKGIFHSLAIREIRENDTYAKLGWLIIVGTIPAGILGLLFEDTFKSLFALPTYAAAFLICNGILLWSMESLKKRRNSTQHVTDRDIQIGDVRIARISWTDSIKVGCVQALALIPGFSRTGAALGGGLLVGLNHEDAARYSFLLATPIIFAAALLKLPELWTSGTWSVIGPIITGSLAAAVAAYFSVRFLTGYFRTNNLNLFALYCVIIGVVCTFIFLL